jgi:hypothetical protein
MHVSTNVDQQHGRYAVGIRNNEGRYRVNLFKEAPWSEFTDLVVADDLDRDVPDHNFGFWVEILVAEGYLELYIRDGYDIAFGEIPTHAWDDSDRPVLRYQDENPLPSGTLAFETLDDSLVQIQEVEVWGPPAQPGLPDLFVQDYEWYLQGEEALVFRVGVTNQGEIASRSSEVYVELVPTEQGTTEPLRSLAPDEREDVFLSLPLPQELRGSTVTLWADVDPGGQVEELDETNNTVQIEVDLPPPDRPATRTPRPTTPPEPLEDGRGDRRLIWLLILIGVVGSAGLLFGLSRLLRGKPRPEQTPDGERDDLPMLPLPPVRLLRIWLSEGGSGGGDVLDDHRPLIAGSVYTLHLQIQPRGAQREEISDVAANHGAGKRLRVVLFAPESDFIFTRQALFLTLPDQGASSEVRYPIRAQQAGHRTLRVGIYFGNVLLQSAVLEADVRTEGGWRPGPPAISRVTDYVASLDLRELGALPQPRVSIFTNRSADGTHWIGLYAVGGSAPESFRQGILHTFGPDELAVVAQELRTLLTDIQGRAQYRFGESRMPDPDSLVARLERDLTRLAVQGYGLYNALFFSRLGADERADALLQFQELTRIPGVIAVARCRADANSIPWAALYDLYLDTNAPLELCGIFKQQLLRGQDLLDRPTACRGQPGCPQRGDGSRTICPFGFWGYVHQVEQPLQKVTPTSVDEVPAQLASEAYEQSALIESGSSADPAVAVAYFPRLPGVELHLGEIRTLAQNERVEVRTEERRDSVVRDMLRQGGFQLLYFYCHGDVAGNLVRLKLGPADDPGYLAAADLDPRWRLNWRGKPHALVILNACETVATTPERVGELMYQLRFLGSAGVVGTEIKVRTELAREVGTWVLKGLLQGDSVGEAFLGLRRHLLRAGNPLGLVYTYHAPASLHLHASGSCAWCRSRLGGRAIR